MKKREKKLQAQSILATVVMGMNLVNAAAPAAALAAAEQPEPLPQQAVGEAQQEDLQAYAYEALPILAGYVDEMIFSKAEAASNYSVGTGENISIGSTVDSDTVYVASGGTCTIDSNRAQTEVAEGGSLNIGNNVGSVTVSGGNVSVTSNHQDLVVKSGNVSVGNSDHQTYVSGGTCIIDVNKQENYVYGGTSIIKGMSDGTNTIKQQIISGGVGSVCLMNNVSGHIEQKQTINAGSGIVGTMSNGYQEIETANASGHIDLMYNGSQTLYSAGKGSIGIMSGGSQTLEKDTHAEIVTMVDGMQFIRTSATGVISTMDGGKQTIGNPSYINASGTIISMTDGLQQIWAGNSGSITTMSGVSAMQMIGLSGLANGSIDTLEAGTQMIGYSADPYKGGGTGTINVMNSGMQIVGYSGCSSCVGTIASMNNGQQQVNDGGTGTITKMSGVDASQIIGLTGSSAVGSIEIMEAGKQAIGYNGNFGTGSITLMQDGVQVIGYVGGSGIGTIATMSGGTQIINNAGTGTVTALLGGSQIVASGGTATDTTVGSGGLQYIEAGAVISGTVLDGGILRLAQADSDYILNNTLTINNGVLDLTDGAGLKRNLRAVPVYQKLTMSDMQGTGGSIYLDTDLANNTGDEITVNNSNTGTGTYAVYVNDQSIVSDTELTGRLLLVDDQSRKLKFKGMTANNGGLWNATPILNEETNQWYLTKIVKTANNDTKVLLFDADNSYAMWRNTNDSLRSRLGALGNGSERADGIWARTQAGRFSGFGYEGRYNLYQLGYDQKADARSTYGLAVDYGDGTGDYTKGSGKDKLTAFSFYGVWQGKRGAYTNVTARAGMFDTDLKSYGDYPDKASYKEHAYSISVEYGRRFDYQQGLFFEPQAQFTLGHLSGISYTTDRGANGYIEGLNSAIGRIGFVMGQKIKNGSDIYLKADLLHEFAGKRDLQLTSDAGGTNDILSKHNDYGDTWFELGLGANIKLSKDSSFYGEVERGFGGDINKKWSVNAGLRFTF
ncbi:autotransporter outer membrane beta-barrel domain-containing protein [uncultured Phascolarctobacterium sp.]|uniref:autotransporter outer membrane beta-barrel domain-containing protein n=1 Tax=uncultured Phascolarctobacterium sp. TaxID=512296 RepID=UPI0025E072BD|nr:autotransporter outer membrane beta-barrel domain-containing protein [uncultured Phascolarctobacterium sp.]